MNRLSAPLAMLLLLAAAASARAQTAVESFYKDKKVRMLVGYGVGTGNDLYMRLLARHIGKHIPGRPTIAPENMPGAGSMVMMNYLYSTAARDGTAIGVPSRNLAVEPLLGNSQARYEALRFTWLGSMSRDVSTCITWHSSGIRTIEDTKRREVPVGATGAPADSNIFPKLINAALGTRFRTVLGYPDSAAVGIAMERGEVDGYCSFTWSAIKSARPQWIAQKQINVILQLSLSKHAELPDVPLAADLAKDDASRQLFALAFGTQKMGRPVAAPPGVPAERAQALRQAFDATMADPEFLADARRTKIEIDGPISGPDVDDILKQIYATPKDVVAKFEAIRDGK
jgi:tripartite-type tricarboxylate transporter receptor subunit TctC